MLTLSNGQQVDEAQLSGESQPDAGVSGLMRVIKGLEGGDYNNRSGDNGSSAGAYQWNNDNKPLKPGELPSHWKNAAAQYLKDTNAPMTPENQNFVAYQQIKAYKDAGRTPVEIDALWNGAHKDANGQYVHNSEDRARKFEEASLGQSNNSIPQNNQQADAERKTFVEDLGTDKGNTERQNPAGDGAPGSNLPNPSGLFGALVKGTAMPFERAATNLVNAEQTIRGKPTTEPFSSDFMGEVKPIGQEGTFAQKVGDSLGAGASIGSTIFAPEIGGEVAGTLGKLFKGAKALENPEIVSILKNAMGPTETMANFSRENATNALGNALKEQSVSEAGGKTEQLILKALQELNPTAAKEGLLKRLAKGGFNLAAQTALVNTLGGKVGGLIHQNITKQ